MVVEQKQKQKIENDIQNAKEITLIEMEIMFPSHCCNGKSGANINH